MGDHCNAILDLEKALEVYDDDYELYCQYGLCLNDFKKYDKAISAFNKVRTIFFFIKLYIYIN